MTEKIKYEVHIHTEVWTLADVEIGETFNRDSESIDCASLQDVIDTLDHEGWVVYECGTQTGLETADMAEDFRTGDRTRKHAFVYRIFPQPERLQEGRKVLAPAEWKAVLKGLKNNRSLL